MSAQTIEQIRNTATVSIIQKGIYIFRQQKNISASEIAKNKIEFPFWKLHQCKQRWKQRKSVAFKYIGRWEQLIRAIFAVQKLNEGWDVLNCMILFGLYEGQNMKGNK